MNDADVLHEAERIVRYIGSLLYGKGPAVQAAVLAELTAIWLRGHRSDSTAATMTMQAEVISLHCAAVRKLVRLADEEAAQ